MQSNEIQVYTYFRLNDEEKKQILEKYINVKPCICACEDFALVLNSNGNVRFIDAENDSTPYLIEWHGVKKLCSGKHHIVGLKIDGSVVAVGENHCGQCNVFEWENIDDVYAKYNCTYGITKDGKTLVAGQLDYDVFSDSFFLDNLTKMIKNVVYETVQEKDERIDLISDVIADLKSKQDIQISKIKNRVTILESELRKSGRS